jgi:hypothetical protein
MVGSRELSVLIMKRNTETAGALQRWNVFRGEEETPRYTVFASDEDQAWATAARLFGDDSFQVQPEIERGRERQRG